MLRHSGTVRIESERLLLRRFLLQDTQAVYNGWTSDSRSSLFMRWQPHTSAKETHAMLETWVSQYSNPAFYQWAIELKQTHALVGTIALFTVNEQDRCGDVAYCIATEHWSRGYASEALSAVLYFAFSRENYNRVEAYHAVENPASGRVMEKAGMVCEGVAREKYRSNRGFEDCRMYAAVRRDILKLYAEYAEVN